MAPTQLPMPCSMLSLSCMLRFDFVSPADADGGLASSQLHVPYSYGWSIIALTALVKLATYPLTKTQVRTQRYDAATPATTVYVVPQRSFPLSVIRNQESGSAHAPHLQVESGLAVQQLKPTIDLIKRRYGDDKDRIRKETAALYEKTGVNPLAGERLPCPQSRKCWHAT